VGALHHVPGRVGADRDEGEVGGRVARAQLREDGPVGGVAGEVEAPAGGAVLDEEAAPERGVAVEEAALAEVDRGQRRDRHAVELDPLVPADLQHAREAEVAEVAAHAERGHQHRPLAAGQLRQRG
jgi:hypothetical protein